MVTEEQIGTEVVKKILKRAKLDYKLGIYPWARAYQMALDAPNVLIYSIARNDKRETLFKWVCVIAPCHGYLYRVKSCLAVKVSTVDDIKQLCPVKGLLTRCGVCSDTGGAARAQPSGS